MKELSHQMITSFLCIIFRKKINANENFVTMNKIPNMFLRSGDKKNKK